MKLAELRGWVDYKLAKSCLNFGKLRRSVPCLYAFIVYIFVIVYAVIYRTADDVRRLRT